MLFNNRKCKALSVEYVSQAHGLDLHQFKWIGEEEVGTLDPKWNHLVGEYPESDDAVNLHYTLGGPYYSEYRDTDNASDWEEEFHRSIHPIQSL